MLWDGGEVVFGTKGARGFVAMVGLGAAMGWQALARAQVEPAGVALEKVAAGLVRPDGQAGLAD